MYYTIGQRKGLNVGGIKGEDGGRWFVIEKDLKNNILYLSHGDEEKLYSSALECYQFNWIPSLPQEKEFECTAKFRYRQPEQRVKVKILEEKIVIEFIEKQRAITEGQYAVLYDGDKCLGGGVIEKVIF
jgi:tRNA-specific 2-thiouridylase